MPTPVASGSSLPPEVNSALEKNGLNLAQIKGYMKMMGLKPQDLPALLKSQGIDDVPAALKQYGVEPQHMPAVLTALGVPPDEQPALLNELGFTQPEKAGDQQAPTDTVSKPSTAKDARLPAKPLSLMPDPKKLISLAIDRDPQQIEKDYTGIAGHAGIALHQPDAAPNRLGLQLGVEKDLGRLQLTGDRAGGLILGLGGVADLDLTLGHKSGDVTLVAGVKPFVGYSWGLHSNLLGVSTETRLGLYGLAQGGGQAGIHNGDPAASPLARVGGGLEAGPLYVQMARDFGLNGPQTSVSSGLNLRF